MENNLRKLVKQFERDPTVGSLDKDLLRLCSIPVIGMPPTERRRREVQIPRNSMENNLRTREKSLGRSNGRIYFYGPSESVLLTFRWNATDGTSTASSTNSTQIHEKQPLKTRENI